MHRVANIPWRALPAWLRGNRLKILMYHGISSNLNDPHAISTKDFQKQMQFLRSKKVVSLAVGLKLLQSRHSLYDTYVITFDDALLDFYTQALPVLREFGYPVTMFVPTGLVGGKAIWDSYDKTKPLMTWQQLDECQQWNVSFGSHTLNHVRLTECDEVTQMNELTFSLQTLHDRLGNVIPALAYPGGYHNERVQDAARHAGYTCGLVASSRWGNGPESDLFQIRRQHLSL